LLKILDLNESASRDEVTKALLGWDAQAFETAAIEAGLCATMYRTSEEWKRTEMGKEVQAALDTNQGCPVWVTRIPCRSSTKPSSTVASLEKRALRVIDMSRVIAAPVAARTLASEWKNALVASALLRLTRTPVDKKEYGADVLLLSSPGLSHLPMLEIDTARGKRTAEVDLNTEKGADDLATLIRGADVFLQAYRRENLSNSSLSP
jgi:crotonobetainyl-CoA:carnitine CoA-transferase CaiB-like acyl-CoA transferase